MQLTRKRMTMLAVLGVGLLGLGVDQVFLGPGSATADDAATALLLDAGSVDIDVVRDQFAARTAPRATEVFAMRLEEVALNGEYDLADLRDVFSPDESWFPDAPAIRRPEPTAREPRDAGNSPEQFRSRHRLTAVMASGARPCIILDGNFHRIGDVIDGYEVIEIRDRAVVLTGDHELVVLELEEPKAGAPPLEDR